VSNFVEPSESHQFADGGATQARHRPSESVSQWLSFRALYGHKPFFNALLRDGSLKHTLDRRRHANGATESASNAPWINLSDECLYRDLAIRFA